MMDPAFPLIIVRVTAFYGVEADFRLMPINKTPSRLPLSFACRDLSRVDSALLIKCPVRQIQPPLQLTNSSAALKSEASELIAICFNSKKAVKFQLRALDLFLHLIKK